MSTFRLDTRILKDPQSSSFNRRQYDRRNMKPTVRHPSPLRYPGGKGFISDYLESVIEMNGLQACTYYEPFAGGAGAALRLLMSGVVSEVHLNDLDRRITSFWRSVLNETERFENAVMTVPLNMDEWRRQKQICSEANDGLQFELGFSTFYLNRCNRSGVLFGAAPIGGYEQSGKWRMDARFYRATLAKRIRSIADMKDRIHISCLDALEFLQQVVIPDNNGARNFTYLDPPYYVEGNRLYFNKYGDEDHAALAQEVKNSTDLAWLASYNKVEYIRGLYGDCQISIMPVRYSMQNKQMAEELIIAPPVLRLPIGP